MAKKAKWEGSKRDVAEDKAMAKKRGMSLKAWEKSPADKAHDAKQRTAKMEHKNRRV